MTPSANIVVPRIRLSRRGLSGDGDLNGARLCKGPLVRIGEGLGNHPLVNRSAGVCCFWGGGGGRSIVGDTGRFGDGGSFFIGVILGKGKPLGASAPPVDDDEVLLPQLELRLPPPVHCPSSRPRTVNNRV